MVTQKRHQRAKLTPRHVTLARQANGANAARHYVLHYLPCVLPTCALTGCRRLALLVTEEDQSEARDSSRERTIFSFHTIIDSN